MLEPERLDMATTRVTTSQQLIDAVASAGPGDEIIAEPGNYSMNGIWRVQSGGRSGNPLVIRGENDPRNSPDSESTILDWNEINNNTDNSGMEIRAPFVHFTDFVVQGSGDEGLNVERGGDNCLIERCVARRNRSWGIMVQNVTQTVTRDCHAHHNGTDESSEGGDGFNGTGSEDLLFERCISWRNSDDGFDNWKSQGHTMLDCVAYENGWGPSGDGRGFKMGSPQEGDEPPWGGHDIIRCVAFNNTHFGFTWNRAKIANRFINCTSVGNAKHSYLVKANGPDHQVINCIGEDPAVESGVTQRNNNWNLGYPANFRSRDMNSDGWLKLPEGSPMIDAGVDTGDVNYTGAAPDLGAFEYGGSGGGGGGGGGTVNRITIDGETLLSAGDADTNFDTTLDTRWSGYEGNGYLNLEPDNGAFASWPLSVPRDMDVTATLRYAQEDTSRTCDVRVNDSTKSVTFEGTGDWASYATTQFPLTLPQGDVELAFETTGDDGPNIDTLTLTPDSGGGGGGGVTEPAGEIGGALLLGFGAYLLRKRFM